MKTLKIWAGFCLLLLACSCAKKPAVEDANEAITGVNFLERIADVSDDLPAETYVNPPSISLKDGDELNLYVKYHNYKFGPDSIRLRSYALTPDGGFDLPVSTTIRVPKSGNFRINVNNDLPLDADQNYLYLMELSQQNLDYLAESNVSSSFADELNELWDAEYTRRQKRRLDSLPKNLFNAPITETIAGEEWEVVADGDTLVFEKTMNVLQQKEQIYLYKKFYVGHSHNTPHHFNTTNMHTHGWHVSPAQDNIFLQVHPENDTVYTYDISDHQAGTFWYHPHVHGATGIQVASGMAGALIVDEDPAVMRRYPELAAASSPAHEKIMLFDQLTYDPLNGEVNDFNVLMWVGLDSLYGSGVHGTTINGRVKPIMKMYPGEVQRWRMIHKGFRTSIAMDFPEDQLEILRISVDGIMFDDPQSVTSAHMAPGNRIDVLVKAKTSLTHGTMLGIRSANYDAECEYFPEMDKCNTYESDKLESLFTVEIDTTNMGPEMQMPSSLPPRAPELIADITEDQLMGERTTDFAIYDPDGKGTQFMVNGKEFNFDRIDEVMILDSADQWKVTGYAQGHPYHIHINPFQVWSFNGLPLDKPQWRDVMYVKDSVKGAYIRSRYVRYTGDFVIHCHILDHEDQGMMQHVRIAPSGTDPTGLTPSLTFPPPAN